MTAGTADGGSRTAPTPLRHCEAKPKQSSLRRRASRFPGLLRFARNDGGVFCLDRAPPRPEKLASVRRLAAIAALVLATLTPATATGPDIDPQTGYRVQNYRAPVKLPVEGGQRIDIAELDRLTAAGAVLVDTMPERGGYDPQTGDWRLVDKRDSIPGATWLPEVGRGVLEPRLAAYFSGELKRLTGGDTAKPIVFFCLADCWMSWNAVKRAASFGYTKLYWFAEGSDGWFEADRDLVRVKPPPVPPLPDEAVTR